MGKGRESTNEKFCLFCFVLARKERNFKNTTRVQRSRTGAWRLNISIAPKKRARERERRERERREREKRKREIERGALSLSLGPRGKRGRGKEEERRQPLSQFPSVLFSLYAPLLTGSQTTLVPGAPSRSIDRSRTSSCSFQSAANDGIESRARWLKSLGWAKTQRPARPKKAAGELRGEGEGRWGFWGRGFRSWRREGRG